MKINKIENYAPFGARIRIERTLSQNLRDDASNISAISRNLSSLGSSMTSSSTVAQSRDLPWVNNQYIDPRKLISNDIKTLKNKIIERHKKIPT